MVTIILTRPPTPPRLGPQGPTAGHGHQPFATPVRPGHRRRLVGPDQRLPVNGLSLRPSARLYLRLAAGADGIGSRAASATGAGAKVGASSA